MIDLDDPRLNDLMQCFAALDLHSSLIWLDQALETGAITQEESEELLGHVERYLG